LIYSKIILKEMAFYLDRVFKRSSWNYCLPELIFSYSSSMVLAWNVDFIVSKLGYSSSTGSLNLYTIFNTST